MDIILFQVSVLVDLLCVRVVGGDQQSVGKTALETCDKAVVGTAVAIATTLPHLAKGWRGAKAGGRVDEIYIRGDELVCAFAPDIRDCADQIVRERLLHWETPLADVHILAVAAVRIRRQGARAVEKRRDGIRQAER